MTRPWLIVSIGALSLGVAACGDYDQKDYNEENAAYDEKGNAAYDAGEAGNEAYDASKGNAAYTPPPVGDVNANNVAAEDPTANVSTNGY